MTVVVLLARMVGVNAGAGVDSFATDVARAMKKQRHPSTLKHAGPLVVVICPLCLYDS